MFGMFECVNVRMSGPSTYGETSHSKNDSIIPNIRNIRSFPIYCFLKHPRQWGFSSLKIGSWKLKRITTRIEIGAIDNRLRSPDGFLWLMSIGTF